MAGRKAYQYITLELFGDKREIDKALNEMGSNSWRLVNIQGGFLFYFEREVPFVQSGLSKKEIEETRETYER